MDDNEPWELEDHGEEKITPIPATIRLASALNDNETSQKNYFSDSFNPMEQTEQSFAKTVRFDDNVQNIRASTPPSNDKTMESEELDVNDITPQFNRMETDLPSLESTPRIDNIDSTKLSNRILFAISLFPIYLFIF